MSHIYSVVLAALCAWGVPIPVASSYGVAMASVCESEYECVLLASLAYVESAHFAAWVLDFSCNDRAWRSKQAGWKRSACDNGYAVGAWQVHDSVLVGSSPESQAASAIKLMRSHGNLWSTWSAAKKQTSWWISKNTRL